MEAVELPKVSPRWYPALTAINDNRQHTGPVHTSIRAE